MEEVLKEGGGGQGGSHDSSERKKRKTSQLRWKRGIEVCQRGGRKRMLRSRRGESERKRMKR